MKKDVKIIGLSVNKSFGGLKATELTFDQDNRLTLVKGEVGSGKTTLNKALSLTTKGVKTLDDNNLYGEVDLTAQLLDGDYNVFVNCKSDKLGKLSHSIYTIDKDGNKLKDVVIDGQKLTPANYLKSLQTSLTWRLDELTSENQAVQKKILLDLYKKELEKKGVIYDKNHSNFTSSIIHKIEKAKNDRNYADMKRKEVGGIATDLDAKGVDSTTRRDLKPTDSIEQQIGTLKADIEYKQRNGEQLLKNDLNDLKTKGLEINSKLKDFRDSIKDANQLKQILLDKYDFKVNELNQKFEQIKKQLTNLDINDINQTDILNLISSKLKPIEKPIVEFEKEIEFNDKGQCVSLQEDFEHDDKIKSFINDYKNIQKDYFQRVNEGNDSVVDTTDLESKVNELSVSLESIKQYNNEAKSVNALHDWKDANEAVKDLQSDYYKKLTGIDTGVKGLHIALDDKEGDNIFLMYDGSYDPDYFHNQNKELRKLSSYSDTQKPLICLLIQNYLISKKGKALPYLWIDKVPIDNKTRALLERMSTELGLWLFVSWTGDFNSSNLSNGELLIENGNVFFN
jgi:hypothetical protein